MNRNYRWGCCRLYTYVSGRLCCYVRSDTFVWVVEHTCVVSSWAVTGKSHLLGLLYPDGVGSSYADVVPEGEKRLSLVVRVVVVDWTCVFQERVAQLAESPV